MQVHVGMFRATSYLFKSTESDILDHFSVVPEAKQVTFCQLPLMGLVQREPSLGVTPDFSLLENITKINNNNVLWSQKQPQVS